ncbi:MAG: acetate/propionate family kinase [Nanoarchaeota archaeon]
MNILTLNIGSSTVKYAVFSSALHLKEEKLRFKGIIDKIKNNSGYIKAINEIVRIIRKNEIKIDIIGHRIVHGGQIRESCLINTKIERIIKKYSEFAPLHNPPELIGIKECKRIFRVKQVAVFDTAFFSELPERSFLYALPYKYYEKHSIRKYGFHGISHKYCSIRASEILKKELKKLKLITCHLGNGCSISAIKYGKCIDTSMGLTPLEGLVMGTRTGDIDVGTVLYLMKKEHLGLERMNRILNKESGLLGISGISNDFRVLLNTKKQRARLAIDVFTYRLVKYIGAYISALQGADAIVFTGGIGENSSEIRELVLNNFEFNGLKLDKNLNQKNAEKITKKDSKISALAIKTDEERCIAKDVIEGLNKT